MSRILVCVLLAVGAPNAFANRAPAPADEPAAVLDSVEVVAARRREIAFHAIMQALERPRSGRIEDKDALVCVRRRRTDTHLAQIECMTNEGWEYRRWREMRAVFGDVLTPRPPYPAREQEGYVLSPLQLARLGRALGAGDADHEARLTELALEDAVARTGDEFGTPTAEVVNFARAFDRVRALAGDGPEVEARLAKTIGAAGLTVEQYNALVERLERSERFRARVATALGFVAQR